MSRLHRMMAEMALRPAVFATIKALVPGMTTAVSALLPGRDASLARLEADNKMTIMQLVLDTERLAPCMDEAAPLAGLVDDGYELGDYPALWAIEGIGHYHAESAQKRGVDLAGLLTDPELDELPVSSLTMLHAGVGLSFGKLAFRELRRDASPEKLRGAIETFTGLCQGACREGFLGCALEALGLVILHVYGADAVKTVGAQLEGWNGNLEDYFWHGVGRASYFSPQNMMPGLRSPWPAVALLKSLEPHERASRNLVAGFAWAVVLVNLRHPPVFEELLSRHGEELTVGGAFGNGIASAMVVRAEVTPGEESIARLRDYEPSRPELRELWQRVVRGPATQAVERFQPVLRQRRMLEQVFRYRSLTELCA